MNVYNLTRDSDELRLSTLDFDVPPSLVGRDSIYNDFGVRYCQRLDWCPVIDR